MKLVSLLIVLLAAFPSYASLPKVRAITGFITVNHDNLEAKVQEALVVVRQAKKSAEDAGYIVQSVRLTTQPFTDYLKGLSPRDALRFVKDFEALALKEGFDPNIGALMPGTPGYDDFAKLLGDLLSETTSIKASLVVANSTGIDWTAIEVSARIIQRLKTVRGGQANFNFTATAMLEPYSPFFPGSYHLGGGRHFAIGLESGNIVSDVFTKTQDRKSASEQLSAALAGPAKTIDAIGKALAQKSGWTYAGLDPTPVFTPKDGVFGSALETFIGAPFGSSGTLTTVAIITKAVKAVPVKQIGYAGLMLPVLEDPVLAKRWSEGKLSIDSLLAYSAVCGTGLDTLPLSGDITDKQLERIIGDMASLAFKWNKPLTARLLPIVGKTPGQHTAFEDPFLVNATLQPLP